MPTAPTRFDRDTDPTPLGGGVYGVRVDRGWWIERGPNGGFVAALVMRAIAAEVADGERAARSLTVHYLAPPAEGDATVTVTIERSGRVATFASARLQQGPRLLALAMAAFGRSLPGPTFDDRRPPELPPPERCPSISELTPTEIPMRERYELRLGIGALPGGDGTEAVVGGWMRLSEPRPLDAPLVAAYADAWIPPVFAKLTEFSPVPTVDLTVHFRQPLPLPSMADDDYVVAVFRTETAADGYLEEDGELWSPDGVLLAESRQLAVLLPPT